MNIDDMTDEEKSVAIAHVCNTKELRVVQVTGSGPGYPYWTVQNSKYDEINLYDPTHMALAAEFMKWADKNLLQDNSSEYRWLVAYNFLYDSQRLALDSMLRLAIKKGELR